MKGGREEEGEEVPSMTEIQDAVELEDLDDVDEAPAELVLLPQHRERQGRKLGWAGTGVKIGGWVNWCQVRLGKIRQIPPPQFRGNSYYHFNQKSKP